MAALVARAVEPVVGVEDLRALEAVGVGGCRFHRGATATEKLERKLRATGIDQPILSHARLIVGNWQPLGIFLDRLSLTISTTRSGPPSSSM